MMEPININAILDAVQKKNIELTPEFLVNITDSRVAFYSVLELMCDYFNSVTAVRTNKDAALICKLKEADKILREKNDSLAEKYNDAMTELLNTKETILDLDHTLSNKEMVISDLKARIRDLELNLERCKLFQ